MVHIGIIPDGNRRWSKKNNADVIIKLKGIVIETINSYNDNKKFKHLNKITEISMYVLSEDNFEKRKDSTVTMITELLYFINEHFTEAIFSKICIQFIGELHKLPGDIIKLCESIISKCDSNAKFRISFALCYDPIKDSLKILNNNLNRP